MDRVFQRAINVVCVSCVLIFGIFSTSISCAASQKSIEFGVLVKSILLKAGNEKFDPTVTYQAGWDQLDNQAYYSYKKKEFAEEYQGKTKPLVIFNGKPAKEAYKKNVNASWAMSAVGSRAGASKVTFSSSVNDGADEDQIIGSLKKADITVTNLTCDEDSKSLETFKTGIMFKAYKLTTKGYLPGTLVIAGDVAAQHISLDLTVIPNTKELYPACK